MRKFASLSAMPTIRAFVIMTLGDDLAEWNRPRGCPDSTTRVWVSVSSSRYFFISRYCIQFWQTWPVSP